MLFNIAWSDSYSSSILFGLAENVVVRFLTQLANKVGREGGPQECRPV